MKNHPLDQALSREKCLAMLGRSNAGRIALSLRSLPIILPVFYVLEPEGVVIGTAADPTLLAGVYDNVVAFEVDEFDPVSREGWSVSVTGIAQRAEKARPARLCTPPGTAILRARIPLGVVSGIVKTGTE